MAEIIYNQDLDQLNSTAVELLKQAIKTILNQKDSVILAVPGGRSVAGLFSLIADTAGIDWEKVHIFMVDERRVGLDDDASNFKLVKESFGKKILESNLHPYIFKPENDDDGLGDYEAELKKYGGKYDIIILGVGEDGHTAALYPNHHSIENQSEYYIKFDDSPKPPPQRMTATLNLLKKSDYAFALFLGEGKKQAFENYKNQGLSIKECPSKLIDEIKNSYVITDLK